MYKKFLLLVLLILLVFLLTFFKSFLLSITGSISKVVLLSLGIANSTQADFIRFNGTANVSFPSKALVNTNITFDVILQNTGNQEITERIGIFIKNSSLQTVAYWYDDVDSLSPLETRRFIRVWAPKKVGTYWFVANASYNSSYESKKVEKNISFKVVYALKVNLYTHSGGATYPSLCAGEDLIMKNELENIGVFNATGNLTDKIVDSFDNEIYSYTWSNLIVPVGETIYEMKTYTISDEDEAGEYTVIGNFTYDNRYSTSSFNFRICKGIGTLMVSPAKIEKNIERGDSATQDLVLWLDCACENAVAVLNKTSGAPGDWTLFSLNELLLQRDLTNKTIINITVPKDVEEGDYSGTVYVSADSQSLSIPLIVHVTRRSIETKVQLGWPEGCICLGSDITAIVNISTTYTEPIDVKVTYRIIDPEGIIVNEKEETVTVNGSLSKNVSMLVPYPGLEGIYTFTVIAEYGDKRDEDSTTFCVIYCEPPTTVLSRAPPSPIGPVTTMPIQALKLNLSTTLLSVVTGENASFIAFVTNMGVKEIKGVKLSIQGISPNWITVTPLKANIKAGEEKEYQVIINVPRGALTGIYKLRVKATDEVQSNEEILTLIVGKNYKEIADLLLFNLEKIEEARKVLLLEECLDIEDIKVLFKNVDSARERGMVAYNNQSYEEAVAWLSYAIPTSEKVINGGEIVTRVEIDNLKKSSFLIPPFFDVEKQFNLAGNYLEEKNYEEICEPIEKIRKYILFGIAFWILLILLLMVTTSVLIAIYKRREKREKILEKIKRREIFKEI